MNVYILVPVTKTKETIGVLENWLDLNEPNLLLSEYLSLKAVQFTLARIYDYELSGLIYI